MLIVSRIPQADCTPDELSNIGKNRFECRTCPYQMILNRRYFERKTFEHKPVEEDVLGGADSWGNVDKTSGMSLKFFPSWCLT